MVRQSCDLFSMLTVQIGFFYIIVLILLHMMNSHHVIPFKDMIYLMYVKVENNEVQEDATSLNILGSL